VETSNDGDVSQSCKKPSLTFLSASLNRHPVRILLDTGASSSFIRASTLKTCRLPMISTAPRTFWLADGTTSFTTVGTAQLHVRINHLVTTISALVVRHLSCECILGMDWLEKYRVDVCHSDNAIRIHDDQGHCLTRKRMNDDLSFNQFPVTLIAPLRLQPYQECQVRGFIPISSSAAVLFHPRPQLQLNKPIRTPEAVLSITDYRTSLTLYNDSDRICHLANGTLLGKVQLIDCNTSLTSAPFADSISNTAQVPSEKKDFVLPESVKTVIASAATHVADDAQRNSIIRLLTRYSTLLNTSHSTLATTSMNHAIRTSDHAPITTRPYPQSQQQRVAMNDHVHAMLKAKQIRLSTSPWSSPALLVAKPDGSTRFVVDFRRLNHITIKDEYPLPNIEDTINQLAGFTFFTKLDLRSGYLQIPIREEDKEKTAFKTKDGLFEFNVLPPGLKNAPPSFQRIMDSILVHGRSSFCLIYLDDIIIFSKTFEEHLVHVESILCRLHLYKFQLNPPKCSWFLAEMNYLGHRINAHGVSPLSEKIEAILRLPMPKTLKEANHFIGALNWYRKFVKNFAEIAAPIHAVTNKTKLRRKEFHWGPNQSHAFNELRSIITSQPLVLDFPDATSPMILSTDASDIGVGAVLRQDTPSGPRVLYYFSQMLTPSQRKYATIEREALAIGLAISKLRPYLLGRPFRIETDHCPLCNFHRQGSRNRRVDWWSIALSEFDIVEVKFKKGTLNCDCDLLSRYPVDYERLQDLSSSLNAITRAQSRKNQSTSVPVPDASSSSPPAAPPFRSDLQSSSLVAPEQRSPLHLDRVKEEQLLDPVIQSIISEHRRNPSPDLVFKDGVLHKVVNCQSQAIEVPFLPQSLVSEVLHAFHNHPSAAHFGRDRTFSKLQSRCFWLHMYEDIRSYIKSCVACARYHIRRMKPAGHLRPITPPSGVFDLVGIDFWGPTTESSTSSNRYVIVLTDYLTKFVIAKPVPTNTAVTTAEFLLETSFTFGVPAHILTDQGTHFRNELVHSLTVALGCKHTFVTAYHPQSNGQVERWNATMRPKLNALHQQNIHDWDDYLPGIVSAYNTGIHSSTGFSPSYLMFGRHVALPFDSARPVVAVSRPSDYLTHLARHRRIVLQQARSTIIHHQQLAKQRHDQHRQHLVYQVGDVVLVRHHGIRSKSTPTYNGPYTVTEILSPHTYIVTNEHVNRPQRVHVNDMHPISSADFSH
jgi:transposase InsO family protein